MKRTEHIYSHPLYYEIGFCETHLERQVRFLLDCHGAHRHGTVPTSILDNGCGTGLYLEKFAQKGLKVTGHDASPQMVEFAAARLSRFGRKANVFEADLRNFRTSRKSDLAVALNGVFNYLLTVDDIVSHLNCVAKALAPDGLYLVSLSTPQELIARPPGFIVSQWSETRGDITVEVDFTYRQKPIDWSTQTFSGLARIRVRDAGRTIRLRLPYRYRIYFPQEILALVALSGRFEVVEIYGDFDVRRIYARMRRPKAMNVLLRKTRAR